MEAGIYDGWLPHLFDGNLLKGQPIGMINAVIGTAKDSYRKILILAVFSYIHVYTVLSPVIPAYSQHLQTQSGEYETSKGCTINIIHHQS